MTPHKNPKKKKIKPGSFQGLGLSPATYKAIVKLGYKVPTPIQRKSIPTIMEGQDVVAMARTGSGKTAAFLIPIIERLASHSVAVGVRAVVLSPTRELAMQTAKFFRQLSRFGEFRCCLLVGGQAMEAQFEHLANNPDIIIATPGRLMHHVTEAELSLSRVQILVLDEADRLFELGFAEQLQTILDATPISRQCLLFSATLPSQLVAFSRARISNPVFIRLDVETSLSEALDLWYLYARKDEKMAAAVSVLRRLHKDKKTTIMFVATRHHVEFFGELLNQLGLTVAIVYGNMDQVARTEQVARFRNQKARILVTTDVAARGVDIPFLDHVLNFDFPASAKLFVHRAGRTARAGRSGICASLLTVDDLPYTMELMLFLGHKVTVSEGCSSARTTIGKPTLGTLPSLEHEVETINALVNEEESHLNGLYKSMHASYNLYHKTRPSASKQSVARAKQLLKDCGGPAQLQGLIHPCFADEAASGSAPFQKEDRDFIQELRGFRPKVEKVGNAISIEAMNTMKKAKFDAATSAPLQQFDGEKCFEAAGEKQKKHVASQAPVQNNGIVVDKPRVSKRRRVKLTNVNHSSDGRASANDFDGWDVQVDGIHVEKAGGPSGAAVPRAKAPVDQFYLSTKRDETMDAKEKGLDMDKYQLDLMPDDSTDIKKHKSVVRWDAKKKEIPPGDGRR